MWRGIGPISGDDDSSRESDDQFALHHFIDVIKNIKINNIMSLLLNKDINNVSMNNFTHLTQNFEFIPASQQ